MPEGRERWSSRTAFVMAAVGSAVGLGNVWRFPYIAFKHGGGAFFIPYFVALLTAGIPIMIVEYALGQRFQAAAPGALGQVNKRFRWVGWFALLVAFTIVLYYLIIMAASWNYMVASPAMRWTRPVEIHEPADAPGQQTVTPAERIVLYHPYRNQKERLRLERLQRRKPKSQRFRILSQEDVKALTAAEDKKPLAERIRYVSFEENVGRYFERRCLGGLDSMATWRRQAEHNRAVEICRRIRASQEPRYAAGMTVARFLEAARKTGKHQALLGEIEHWRHRYKNFDKTLEATMPAVLRDTARTGSVLGDMFKLTPRLAFWSLVTWVAIFFIIAYGVKAVGRVVMWTVPLPVLLLLIMLVHSITLDGAGEGIRYYLTPNWGVLKDSSVWIAAYGQIFFSLSLGFGILIAYASYLPRGRDVTNNAFLTSFANCATSFLAGFVVFSVLGYLAYIKGDVPIDQVAKAGPGLVFVMYPIALAKFPGIWGNVVGVLFFLCLLLLGIDSAFSLVEAVLAGLTDSFRRLNRKIAARVVCALGFLLGLPFATKGGFVWLDIVDNWMNNYGLVIVGLLQCLAVSYFFRLEDLVEYINERSEIHLHWWFNLFIKVVTPAVLIYLLALQMSKDIGGVYGGYDAVLVNAVNVAGWGYFALLVIAAMVLARSWDLVAWFGSAGILFLLYRMALGKSDAALTAALATVVLLGGFLSCLFLALRRSAAHADETTGASP